MHELKSTVYKLNASSIRSTLMEVKVTGTSFFVLDCPGRIALEILRVAKSLDMVNFYFHYILTAWVN